MAPGLLTLFESDRENPLNALSRKRFSDDALSRARV